MASPCIHSVVNSGGGPEQDSNLSPATVKPTPYNCYAKMSELLDEVTRFWVKVAPIAFSMNVRVVTFLHPSAIYQTKSLSSHFVAV
jgi:hypothetical protein